MLLKRGIDLCGYERCSEMPENSWAIVLPPFRICQCGEMWSMKGLLMVISLDTLDNGKSLKYGSNAAAPFLWALEAYQLLNTTDIWFPSIVLFPCFK